MVPSKYKETISDGQGQYHSYFDTINVRLKYVTYQDTQCVAQPRMPAHCTVGILTGRTKAQFSRMHSSMTLSEKHTIFALL